MPWILKSDDDMIINTLALSPYLHKLEKHFSKELLNKGFKNVINREEKINNSQNLLGFDKILCAVWYGMPVLRGEPKDCAKWCVSHEQWPYNQYPIYCSGSAFLIPTHLAPRLYTSYFKSRFLWVDDAYISGVLAKTAGVTHRPIHSLYELNHFLIEKNLIRGNRLFCHHPGKAAERKKWWPLIAEKERAH